MIFATQALEGLHNRVAGNATTQFFGALHAPVQVEAAREMAKMRVATYQIFRLKSGEFYVAVEGDPPQKVRTSMCLSHHPRSPLTTDEVLARSVCRRRNGSRLTEIVSAVFRGQWPQ